MTNKTIFEAHAREAHQKAYTQAQKELKERLAIQLERMLGTEYAKYHAFDEYEKLQMLCNSHPLIGKQRFFRVHVLSHQNRVMVIMHGFTHVSNYRDCRVIREGQWLLCDPTDVISFLCAFPDLLDMDDPDAEIMEYLDMLSANEGDERLKPFGVDDDEEMPF